MTIIEAITKLHDAMQNPVVQWLFWTIGSIVMLFTPDHVDAIIASILAILGVNSLAAQVKK